MSYRATEDREGRDERIGMIVRRFVDTVHQYHDRIAGWNEVRQRRDDVAEVFDVIIVEIDIQSIGTESHDTVLTGHRFDDLGNRDIDPIPGQRRGLFFRHQR
nr:hypothetical protein [Nocardia lijiangensis]